MSEEPQPRFKLAITAILFLLLHQPVHAATTITDADSPEGKRLNSMRSAFQKWQDTRKHPESLKSLAIKAQIEHFRKQAERQKYDSNWNDLASQSMIEAYAQWMSYRKAQ